MNLSQPYSSRDSADAPGVVVGPGLAKDVITSRVGANGTVTEHQGCWLKCWFLAPRQSHGTRPGAEVCTRPRNMSFNKLPSGF